MKVYIVSGTTESGDDYLYVWRNPPDYVDFLTAIRKDWPDEFDEDGLDATMNLPDAASALETED
ncbi:hypothetical protein SAMN02983003_0631 [Devosia enhydra]|uniref:Uncharacterized protein n=1 Tax=Devosia enhydra TaxID=665118 RepID=A0A1K2HVB8_9HYPH|nr:hypothetical protein [Devosia enhydra]SFZ81681.1 hypothetical protein SAMN02983003_0631 [Devosia enhydra]